MEAFHVFDVMIDAPHVKRKLYLPVWIKRVTGVMFFPVVPVSRIPDGEPLGVAALSLENEKVNAVTNMMVFKKAPCFYRGTDMSDAGGETFLDRGYGAYDFYECNDAVSPNSYVLFKYANRKLIKTLTDAEELQIAIKRLNSLINKRVSYRNRTGTLYSFVVDTDRIRLYIDGMGFYILLSNLKNEIYEFLDPDNNGIPFFDNDDFDEPYKLKIILRYEIDK